MGKKYDYGRLYDYCVKDDFKTSSRGIIRRKSRVLLGIFSYISIVFFIILEILGVFSNELLTLLVIMCFLCLIYWTRMGFISFLNIYIIKNTRKKAKQSILEKFYIYHNKDGNYIKIQEKEMIKIKHHILNWSVIKIIFRDKQKNKYSFRVNLKGIYIKINLSKSCEKKCTNKAPRKIVTKYGYNLNDLERIRNTNEFMIFLKDEYRKIREGIICQ